MTESRRPAHPDSKPPLRLPPLPHPSKVQPDDESTDDAWIHEWNRPEPALQ